MLYIFVCTRLCLFPVKQHEHQATEHTHTNCSNLLKWVQTSQVSPLTGTVKHLSPAACLKETGSTMAIIDQSHT